MLLLSVCCRVTPLYISYCTRITFKYWEGILSYNTYKMSKKVAITSRLIFSPHCFTSTIPESSCA